MDSLGLIYIRKVSFHFLFTITLERRYCGVKEKFLI